MNKEKNIVSRKTKIVATIGPASSSSEKIKELILAGANVFRLNFSHGTHEEHLAVYNRIRKVANDLEMPIAVLQDLSGPKIRITEADQNKLELVNDEQVILRFNDGSLSTSECIYVNLVNPAEVLKPGHEILLADGIMVLKTESVHNDHVICRIIKGGKLRSRIGIAFPDSYTKLSATTEKDLIDFDWGLENGVDFFAVSFVQNADDLKKLRIIAQKTGKQVRLVAKIELKIALENIDEIMDEADAIMVARGDLGVELPIEKIPLIQKDLIERSNNKGIPVIVATQMLHSMVNAIRPTRAEVIDCANAVMTGADAVMLSEETAIGSYPAESVGYLNRISLEAETSFTFEAYRLRLRHADRENVSDSVAYAACAAAIKVGAACIIACTETGTTARLMAKYRPQQPLYGLSRNPETLRRLALHWGVTPLLLPEVSNHADEIDGALKRIEELNIFDKGSLAVITGGLSVKKAGSTSVMQIRSINN
jgi:pyruvate kinase